MEKLVRKWRRCAQKTSERVFVTARNRIDSMGGYREFMKNQKERLKTWDDDVQEQQDSQEEQLRPVDEEEEREVEVEFTMEIMLRMAGVEEKLIGWDRASNNFEQDR